MAEQAQPVRFDVFEVDPRTGELRKNGRKLKLQEQPFQILLALLESCGEVVTREDLRQRLWPADTFVDFDNGLNIAVQKLRRALADDAERPRYIETLPRRGYRFIGPIDSRGAFDGGPAGDALPHCSPSPISSLPHDRVVSISQGLESQSPKSTGQRDAAGAAHLRGPVPQRIDTEPLHAPSSAPDAAPALAVLPAPVAHPLAPQLRVVWLLAISLVGALCALAWGWQRSKNLSRHSSLHPGGSASAKLRRSVALMGFRNLSAKPDVAWLSNALSEMLGAELSAGERLLTIPGEGVAEAKIDLSLPETDGYSPETLSRVRKRLGADYVVVGSYLASAHDSSIHLGLRLQDARSGETLVTLSEAGMEDDLPALAARTGAALRTKLGLDAVTAEEASGVRAVLPSGPEAARLYAEALARLRLYDARGARDLLERAVAIDPDFALAHSALARAWSALGYGELAKQEAQKAFELSAILPRAERLSVEAGYREATAEWDKAIAIYRTLFSFFPDNLDYGLRLARAEVKAGKGSDALKTVAALRKLPVPLGDHPAIDLAESLAADQLGDFKRAQAAAVTAADRAQTLGAEMLMAEARVRQCRELPLLGRLDEARAACERSREIYARAGDRDGVASATAYLAAVLANQGEIETARQMYEQALAVDRTLQNKGGMVWELNGLANTLWAQGDLSAAQESYQQALGIARETGSRPDEADALGNIAFTLLLQGNLAQARKMLEQTLADYRAMSDRRGVGSVLDNLGETLYFQGDLPGAARALDEALATDRETGNKPESADVLAWSGSVRMAQGDLDAARQQYNQALTVWREMGDRSYLVQYSLKLAQLAVEAGHPAEAEAPLREGLELFRQKKRNGAELEAHTLLARALLEEGRPAEARREIDQAASLVSKTQSRAARLGFSIAAAQARAASGKGPDVAEAERSLQTVLTSARRDGFLGYELEARLALGQIEMKAGRNAGGAGLTALEKDAAAKGFGLIARKASAAEAAGKG